MPAYKRASAANFTTTVGDQLPGRSTRSGWTARGWVTSQRAERREFMSIAAAMWSDTGGTGLKICAVCTSFRSCRPEWLHIGVYCHLLFTGATRNLCARTGRPNCHLTQRRRR